jgi:nicotinamide-nucleotide amidase
MEGVLLFIGNELISGKVINTNVILACREFNAYGLKIREVLTLPDKLEVLIFHLRRLAEEVDFVVASGGLGPTDDDITNLAVAQAFNVKLVKNKEFLSAIRECKEYEHSQEIAEKMALLPEGAKPLADKDSITAGYYLSVKAKDFFFLPGVPSQYEELLQKKVIPFLLQKVARKKSFVKIFMFFDLNETDLNLFFENLPSEITSQLKIGYYPVFPEVKLILQSYEKEVLKEVENLIKEKLGVNLISTKGERLPEVIGEILREKRAKLSTAESCTGGKLASLITSIPGSSDYFERGFVTYSPESKVELLGVKKEIIEEYGVVSFETALEMAKGARERSKADFSLSLTGFAGPTGGDTENPVGTVYIGLASKNHLLSFKFIFQGSRTEIQTMASYTALDILRRYILYDKNFSGYRFAVGTKEKTL